MKHSRNLQALIYRSYLTSSLVPILMIELVLLILYFGTNSYISRQNQATLLAEVSQHLQDVTFREAAKIDTQLKEVSRDARLMQQDHEAFFHRLAAQQCLLPDNAEYYAVHPNGAYHKQHDTGGSSLYYAATTTLGTPQIEKARCSEQLDTLLRSIVTINPVITQAYINTWDNMTRIYPFIEDTAAQFGPALNVNQYNFYYLADSIHNPEKKPVWTGVYLDPAGQGWMISNVVPIYNDGFLEGVSGLDVTISIFINQILSMQMPWQAQVFMVDGEGRILAAPPEIGQLLHLPALKTDGADTQSHEFLNQSQEYNLLATAQSQPRRQLQQMYMQQQRTAEITIGPKQYLVSQEIIPETGWRLFTLVDESLIFSKIFKLKGLSDRLGMFAIIAMLLFYALFFWYLQQKSIRIAARIATPIKKLSDATSHLGGQVPDEPFPEVGVEEIDTLNRNFSAMTRELDVKTRQVIDFEIREKVKQREAELLETLALTDRLTGLANRHKLDEILDHEFARAVRFENRFGVIIMDIDHFKQINDSYGHQTGDLFLQEMAGILKQHTRKTDTVGRWGGEEFMIICPKTSHQGILEVAEHLRSIIATHDFNLVGRRTASFGATLSKSTDTIDSIIRRADKALYQAKHHGRNRTETG